MVVTGCRGDGPELAARPVFVVGMVDHVLRAQALRLVDELPLLGVGQQLPGGAESLRDLRVVHLGVLLHAPTVVFVQPLRPTTPGAVLKEIRDTPVGALTPTPPQLPNEIDIE